MKRTPRITTKRFLVGIPVPSLDGDGKPLHPSEIDVWVRRTSDELTACFGGATPVPAPGMNVVQGPHGEALRLFEEGQTLVLAACQDRRDFLSKRQRLAAFAETMADALRQEAVFVTGWPSESFLVEGRFHGRKREGKE